MSGLMLDPIPAASAPAPPPDWLETMVALGLGAVVTASESIPDNTLVAMDGDPDFGYSAFLPSGLPASAFAPYAIAIGAQGIVIFSGIVQARPLGSYGGGTNLYVYNDGRVSDSPGLKGAVSQFVGVSSGSSYESNAFIPVALEFGEWA